MASLKNRIVGHDNIDPTSLAANPKNWRIHPALQKKSLEQILDEVGWVADVIVNLRSSKEWGDEQGVKTLVDGHLRVDLAVERKEKSVPVLYVDLDPDEEALVLATFDPLAGMARTNTEELDSLLSEIRDGREELLADMGCRIGASDDLDSGAASEPPKDPIVKTGELWLLGGHRLLCGDSLITENLDRLMDGARAQMVYADPPYGMALDTDYSQLSSKKTTFKNSMWKGKKHKDVIGDDKPFDPGFLMDYFAYCKEQFWWGGDYYSDEISGRSKGSWIVWDKRVEESLDDMFGSCFELCWSKTRHQRRIARAEWAGIFGMSKEPGDKRFHPTQKPVILAEWFLQHWGKGKKIVVDLFLGAGSSLLACEKTKRKCYAAEIDPAYCDIAIKRWEDYTGEKARRKK